MFKLILLCVIVTTVLSGSEINHHPSLSHSSSYQNFNTHDSKHDSGSDFHPSPVIVKKEHKHSAFSSEDDHGSYKSLHSSPEVCAKAGCVNGKVEHGRKEPYDAFYGIPYAEPPVGKLRLENPIPYKGWKGHWDATFPRNACTQRNIYIHTQPIVGSEDCLYLNVYRPHKRTHKHLPVLVFIHGGSFLSGSSSPRVYGPEYLMDNGEVILVTVNYRLGMFGFLCSGDESVKGNFGLKDQQLALKWVAANIGAFGGDPHSVTLVGFGSGAVSAQLHLMNQISSNLFHRVVLLSGNALTPWAFSYDEAIKFRLSAKATGHEHWDTASTLKLAHHFKDLKSINLVLGVDKLIILPLTPPTPLRPCIEGHWEGAFIKEDPRKLWAQGRYAQMPIILGASTDEGTITAPITLNHTTLHIFNENINKYLPIQLNFEPRFVGDVLRFYLGKDHIDDSNVQSYYQMVRDRAFIHPFVNVVKQHVKNSVLHKSPIFLFEMGFKSAHTFVEVATGLDKNLGVSHFDTLHYLFNIPEYFPTFDVDTPEGLMVETFVRTFVHFAHTGEMKAWAKFEDCTSYTNKPSCERQVFKRLSKHHGPDTVSVSVTKRKDLAMLKLWDNIDKNFNY